MTFHDYLKTAHPRVFLKLEAFAKLEDEHKTITQIKNAMSISDPTYYRYKETLRAARKNYKKFEAIPDDRPFKLTSNFHRGLIPPPNADNPVVHWAAYLAKFEPEDEVPGFNGMTRAIIQRKLVERYALIVDGYKNKVWEFLALSSLNAGDLTAFRNVIGTIQTMTLEDLN